MACIWMDSVDHYPTANLFTKWTGGGATGWTVVTNGRTGGNCLLSGTMAYGGANSYGIVKNLEADLPHIVAGAAFLLAEGDPVAPQPTFCFMNNGSPYFTIGINTDGGMCLWRNASIDPLDFGYPEPFYISEPYKVRWGNQSWFYLEASVYFHTTAGSCGIRVNQVEVVNLKNINTGGFLVNQFRMSNSNTGQYRVDDIYLDDLNYRNDLVVFDLTVSGSGASGDWTVFGAPSLWEAVDENPPDADTTYIYDSIVGHSSTFNTTDLPAKVQSIMALQTICHARKDDSGVRKIATFLVSGGFEVDSRDFSLNSGYEIYLDQFETDPATGLPWTPSGVANAQVGVKVTV